MRFRLVPRLMTLDDQQVMVNTDHRCIWHRLAAICDAKFLQGVVNPHFGERVIVGGWR